MFSIVCICIHLSVNYVIHIVVYINTKVLHINLTVIFAYINIIYYLCIQKQEIWYVELQNFMLHFRFVHEGKTYKNITSWEMQNT